MESGSVGMKRNGRRSRKRGEVLIVDEVGLRRLIDQTARKRLGISGEEALARLQKGQAEDNYVWTGLSMMASMLR